MKKKPSLNNASSLIGEFIKKRKTLLLSLSAMVVFVTTYMLILPALTLEEDEAVKQGGIDVPASEQLIETEASQDSDAKAGPAFAGDGYTISLDAGKSAKLPEDTELTAAEVTPDDKDYEAWCDEALKALQESPAVKEDISGLKSARFYDITLLSDGSVVEPSDSVNVNISYDKALKMKNKDDVKVIHFGVDKKGNLKPEVLKESAVDVKAKRGSKKGTIEVSNVAFDATGFSMYGVVETSVYEKTIMTADGKTYKLTVTAGADAQIPQDAELEVSELTEKDADYRAYADETADALGTETKDLGYSKFLDITIVSNGDSVQPQAPVDVQIQMLDRDTSGDVQVVHFGEKREVLEASTEGDTVSFKTEGFSIYAVVDEGDTSGKARMTVEFYNGDTLVATMYVKNDDTLKELETILYDPGVGSLDNDEIFKGWTTNKDYTVAESDGMMSIADVRVWAEDRTITENETIKFYAGLYKTYTVTYKDENNATLGTDSVLHRSDETSAQYTVNMAYTPTDDTHHFEGWNVSAGGSFIDGYTENALYTNGTDITIRGNVTFSVNAPEGHWLIFDENGKGGTYNAPVFVVAGENTVQPENTKAENMKRTGYTFGGWYKDAACTDGNEFTFGSPITDNTTIYAKWIPAPTAKYTVIVWKQSVSDNYDASDSSKTYDYAFSKEFETASNTPVSSLDLSAYQNKDGQNINVDGTYYSFYGFKYNTTKGVVSNETTVLPNGTTVINLYYDREVVTYDFNIQDYVVANPKPNNNQINNGVYYILYNGQYCPVRRSGGMFTSNNYLYVRASDISGTQYAAINGNWVELDYDFGTVDGVQGYYWWYYDNGWRVWRDTRYVRSNTTINLNNYTVYVYDWSTRETFLGLYEQKLSKYNYEWPTDYRWFNAIGGNTFTSIMDMFGTSVNDNPSNEFHSDFYGYQSTFNTNVYHYLQNVDLTYPNTPTYTIPTVIGNGMVFRNFQGFTASEFRIKLPDGITTYQTGTSYADASTGRLNNPVTHTTTTGWTDWLPYGTAIEYNGNNNHETTRWAVTAGGIEFRYERQQFPLTYMVGQFVNASGEVQEAPITGMLNEVDHIEYEDTLESYAKGGENYYEPPEQKGYVFAGWYIDPTCTTPVDFSNTTMPINGMTVYGKWVQEQYRVFLHPNVPASDTTLDWGSESQQMNFRVDLDETVSVPTGRRTGYEMVGWYLDPDCKQVFNADAYRLNDDTVTTPYDKTTDFTDVMDKWGNGATYNGDTDRFWINKKFDLYAKWRAVLEGAEGIGVLYDAGEGSGAPTDTLLYLDSAYATAQAASTPPAPTADGEKVFGWWVMQRWDETKGEYVEVEGADPIYPGDNFEVLRDYARKEQKADHTAENPSYSYTVQLKAHYVDIESRTPTHITWYANNGTGNTISDEHLHINEAVPVKPANTFSYNGYEFIGWARIEETDAQGQPQDIPDLMNLTEEDVWLSYDKATGKFTLNESDSFEVEKIAADERLAYHGMVAVWVPKKYSVTVIKHVEGTSDDEKTPFEFRESGITAQGSTFSLVGSSEDVTIEETTYQNTKLFTDVPYGTEFSITEVLSDTFATTLEYTCLNADDKKKIITVPQQIDNGDKLVVDGDIIIEVTNTRKSTPVSIVKVDEEGKPLENAEFQFVGKDFDGRQNTKWISTQTDGEGDAIIIENESVPLGTYTLSETNPPAGYNALDGNVEITLNSSNTGITVSAKIGGEDIEPKWIKYDTETGKWTISIQNSAGVALPSTGGPGTHWIYILGSILLLGCGVTLIGRRRIRNHS